MRDVRVFQSSILLRCTNSQLSIFNLSFLPPAQSVDLTVQDLRRESMALGIPMEHIQKKFKPLGMFPWQTNVAVSLKRQSAYSEQNLRKEGP